MKRHPQASPVGSISRRGLLAIALTAAALVALFLAASASALTYNPGVPPTFCTGTGGASGQCSKNLRGMAVDQLNGRVYMADSENARISEYAPSGTFLKGFGRGVVTGPFGGGAFEVCTTNCVVGGGGGALGSLSSRGLAIDPTTQIIYVVNGVNKVAYFHAASGAFLGEFIASGTPAAEQSVASPPAPQPFTAASGVAVDISNPSQHYLYVTTGNGTTQPPVIDKFKVPVPASLIPPAYVCQITGTETDTSVNHTECGNPTPGTTNNNPAHRDGLFNGILHTGQSGGTLAVDSAGSVYLAESTSRNTVSMFSSSGDFVRAFAATSPTAVAAASGRVFVADSTGGSPRVEEFKTSNGALASTISLAGSSIGIAVDASGLASNGSVYAGTSSTSQISKFIPGLLSLTVGIDGSGSGTVQCKVNGAPEAPCAPGYPEGTELVLLGAPGGGSDFAMWRGDCVTVVANECSLTMSEDKKVTATFVPSGQKALVALVSGAGAGSLQCSVEGGPVGPCASAYAPGTSLVVSGAPGANSQFDGFSGGTGSAASCTGTSPCSFTLSAHSTLSASFSIIQRALTVTVNGTGTGKVNAPGGISDCTKAGTGCVASYGQGSSVTLTASADANQKFAGWSGPDVASCDQTGNTLTCPVTIPAHNVAITATFNTIPRNVALTVFGPVGSGKVSASSSPIANCTSSGGACSGSYAQGTSIVLTAAPATHYRFNGWSGPDVGSCDQTGNTLTCPVTIPARDIAISASFVLNAPSIISTASYRVSDTSVRLSGTISPRGSATGYSFHYGITPALGSATEPVAIGAGSNPVIVSQDVKGLKPNTTYYFTVFASNLDGTAESAISSFTTLSQPLALPEARVYEQVSPPDKGLTNVDGAILNDVKFTPSEDGDSLAYCNSSAGGALISAAAYCGDYLIRRTAQGWVSKPVSPVACGQGQQQIALYGDFDYAIIAQPESDSCGVDPLDPNAPVPGKNLYRESLQTPAPAFDLLTPSAGLPSGGAAGPFNSSNGVFQGASDDQTHLVYRSTGDQAGEGLPVSGADRIYEWDAEGGQVRLVSRSVAGAPLSGDSTVAGNPEPMSVGRGRTGGISADGERIFFQNPVDSGNFGCDPVDCELYMREADTTTFKLSEQECSPACPEASAPDVFWWANPAGDKVLFGTAAKLLNGDPSGSGGSDLYMYRHGPNPAAEQNLTLLSPDSESADGSAASFRGVLGMSDDGDTVFFVANSQLIAGQPTAAGPKVYRWRWNGGGPQLRYLGTLVEKPGGEGFRDDYMWNFGTSKKTLIQRVTPDGGSLLVDSLAPLAPQIDLDTTRDVYRWTEQSGWDCLSCQAPGAPSAGTSNLWGMAPPIATADTGVVGQQDGYAHNSDLIRMASDDGKRIFFTSKDRLTNGDVNDAQDVYEWDEGTLSLISAGTGSVDSKLIGTTPSGDDVFFVTADRLVGWDTDTLRDVYDARVGGGLPEPPPTGAPCEGEACRSAASPAAPVIGASTAVFEGPGNPRPESKGSSCRKGTRKVRVHGHTVCKKPSKHPKKHKRHSNRKGR